MRTLTPLVLALALCGCGDRPAEAASDFGAAQAAHAAAEAERACAVAGFEDLASCVDAPGQEARRGAKTAISMAETYRRLCMADLSADRCDGMLMSAYYSAVAKK